ncbi:hypothetical protein [Rhabdochromatium marinum]|uniref:TlpA family protein disulfide reductase n=1 Tax=Rhabdochromatium marinum TaxID=48729 RepID=UPI0030845374
MSIAIDTPEDIQDFTSTRTINYQILLGGLKEMKLAQRFGNRTQSLPFTIVFDYQGHAVFHYAGALSEERLNAEVSALLPDTTTPPAQVSAPQVDPSRSRRYPMVLNNLRAT